MQWGEGKTREKAQVIEPRDLELVLGGLPPGKEHCVSLAVKAPGALYKAINQDRCRR
jgi:hypothetical protein